MPFFLLLLPVLQSAAAGITTVLASTDVISIETRNLIFTVLMIPVPVQVAAVAHSLKGTNAKVDEAVKKSDAMVEEVVEVRRAQALLSSYREPHTPRRP